MKIVDFERKKSVQFVVKCDFCFTFKNRKLIRYSKWLPLFAYQSSLPYFMSDFDKICIKMCTLIKPFVLGILLAILRSPLKRRVLALALASWTV